MRTPRRPVRHFSCVEASSALRVEDLRTSPISGPKKQRTRTNRRHGCRRQTRRGDPSTAYEADYPVLPQAGVEVSFSELALPRKAPVPLYETPLMVTVARQENGYEFMKQVPENKKCIDMSTVRKRYGACLSVKLNERRLAAAVRAAPIPTVAQVAAQTKQRRTKVPANKKERRMHQVARHVVKALAARLMERQARPVCQPRPTFRRPSQPCRFTGAPKITTKVRMSSKTKNRSRGAFSCKGPQVARLLPLTLPSVDTQVFAPNGRMAIAA